MSSYVAHTAPASNPVSLPFTLSSVASPKKSYAQVLVESLTTKVNSELDTLTGRMDALVNGASASLDSFVEVVQAFQTADGDLSGAISTLATNAQEEIDALDVRVGVLETAGYITSADLPDLTLIEGGVGANADAISNLTTRVGDVETDVAGIQSDIGTLQGDVASNSGRLSNLETAGYITSANLPDLTTIESNIATLQGQMTNAQSSITVNAGNISTNSGNITSNTTSIATLTGQMTSVQSSITTIGGDIADIYSQISQLWASVNPQA